VLIFLNSYPNIALTFWILLNIIVIIYTIKFKPYQKGAVNIRDIIVDINFMIIHIFSYPFIDDQLNADDKDILGWIILVACLLILL